VRYHTYGNERPLSRMSTGRKEAQATAGSGFP